jgi:hypothetical protein
MVKTIYNKEPLLELQNRVAKLTPNDTNSWGKMTATEMLYHCNLANRQLLNKVMQPVKPSFKAFTLKILALYLVPHFPKNREGNPQNDTHGCISDSDFQNQLFEYNSILNELHQSQDPITLVHPSFGTLTKKEWGIAIWKHLDHHLRQFNR